MTLLHIRLLHACWCSAKSLPDLVHLSRGQLRPLQRAIAECLDQHWLEREGAQGFRITWLGILDLWDEECGF